MDWGRRIILLICLSTLPGVVLAQATSTDSMHSVKTHPGDVMITEIMYDPLGADSGREWIEVYNAGSTSIKLSDLKLYEGGVNHKISALGVTDLASGQYAVVATNPSKFSEEYSDYAGVIFKSALSLGNSGDTIILRDVGGADVSFVQYVADSLSSGVGNSLQRDPAKSAKSFSPQMPTPGNLITSRVIQPVAKEVATPKTTSARAKKVPTHTSAKSASKDTGEKSSSPGVEADTYVDSESQVAGVAVRQPSSSWWWVGALGLAVVAGIATYSSRHVAKREWDISEMD